MADVDVKDDPKEDQGLLPTSQNSVHIISSSSSSKDSEGKKTEFWRCILWIHNELFERSPHTLDWWKCENNRHFGRFEFIHDHAIPPSKKTNHLYGSAMLLISSTTK
jgi:hypothetical protein